MVGGGIFNPKLMWVAIVDRDGRLCTAVKNGDALFGLNNTNPSNPVFDDNHVPANGFVPGGS